MPPAPRARRDRRGRPGPQGLEGPVGRAGASGPQGASGAAGPRGASRPDRRNGSNRGTGATGATGATRAQGETRSGADGDRPARGHAMLDERNRADRLRLGGDDHAYLRHCNRAGWTAAVRINEVQTGTSSSAADEFVEIVNAGTATAEIGGWKIVLPLRFGNIGHDAGDDPDGCRPGTRELLSRRRGCVRRHRGGRREFLGRAGGHRRCSRPSGRRRGPLSTASDGARPRMRSSRARLRPHRPLRRRPGRASSASPTATTRTRTATTSHLVDGHSESGEPNPRAFRALSSRRVVAVTHAVHAGTNALPRLGGSRRARGRRHIEGAQEEVFLVLEGTLTILLGDPFERIDLSRKALSRSSPGRRSSFGTKPIPR